MELNKSKCFWYNEDNLIKKIPANTREFYCCNQKLIELPILPDTLYKLYKLDCSHNYLTTLPELLITLRILYCSNNHLTKLPELPLNLKKLYCNFNKLTELPILPKNLKQLYCGINNISELLELPKSIEIVDCLSNNIKYLSSYNLEIIKRTGHSFSHNPVYEELNNYIYSS
jgi:Leucine-rich repeat (LRR) protein